MHGEFQPQSKRPCLLIDMSLQSAFGSLHHFSHTPTQVVQLGSSIHEIKIVLLPASSHPDMTQLVFHCLYWHLNGKRCKTGLLESYLRVRSPSAKSKSRHQSLRELVMNRSFLSLSYKKHDFLNNHVAKMQDYEFLPITMYLLDRKSNPSRIPLYGILEFISNNFISSINLKCYCSKPGKYFCCVCANDDFQFRRTLCQSNITQTTFKTRTQL